MSWRDQIRPGSFRGVPFFVDASRLAGGRKVIEHEYPLRDTTFVEDLGRRGRVISVEAYLIGDDYIEQRDRLLDALEAEGPGRLVLPYLQVETLAFAVPSWSVEERREEGGFAKILIEFLETSPEPLFPKSLPDNTAEIDANLAKTFDTLGDNFEIEYEVAGVPPFTLKSLASVVASAGAALRTAFAPVTGAIGAVTGAVDQATAFAANIKQQVDAIVLDADMLVRSPVVAVARFRDLFEALFQSPTLPARNIDALLEAYAFKSDTPPPAPVTTNRAREAANYGAIESLIKRMAVVSAARFAPRATFESYEQAVSTRARITDLLEQQAETARDDVYQTLVELRALLVWAVPGEDNDLPRLLSFTPLTTLPSVVVAHRLYGNVARELEFVARNRIRHPGFVLGGRALQVLSDA
jgi:prophage DNA circulation protein